MERRQNDHRRLDSPVSATLNDQCNLGHVFHPRLVRVRQSAADLVDSQHRSIVLRRASASVLVHHPGTVSLDAGSYRHVRRA